jgi:ATP-binding cassette subfamily B protein
MARHGHHRDLADDGAKAPISREGLREVAGLFRYVLPYRTKLIAAQAFLLVSTIAGLAFPYLTGELVDSAQRLGSVGRALRPGGWSVNAVAGGLVLVLGIQAICSFFQTYWLAAVGERSLADLRRDVYGHVIRLPMGFFGQRRVGELSSRLAADLSLIQGMLTGSVPQFLAQCLVLGGGLILIGLTSFRLTLAMLATLPVAVVMTTFFGRWTRRISRDAQDRLADTGVVIEETLQGIASVKAFANETYETARYRAGIDSLIGVVLRGARVNGLFSAFVTFVLFGSIVVVMWYGSRLVEQGALTVGELTRFLLYTMYVGGAGGQFARLYGEVQRTIGATQRVRELLREPAEDLEGADASAPLNGRFAGEIVYDDVTFAYPSRREAVVLRGLSLAVRAGQRVALVGPSGAGKSTIVALLLRFYEPDSGRLLIDGHDARRYSLHALRNQMAIVPQEVLLFGGSIAENIAYGRPGATATEIERAARQANAHDFIVGFPDGYQTLVGDRGVKLSGGQRQRIAIARAVLKDPAILILDEATSALDSESEKLVQQALDTLMRGRTSVIIAHRLATVRRADRIFVIKEGTVIEAGTHEELVGQRDGVYRGLSELQFDLSPAPAAETDAGMGLMSAPSEAV